MTESNWQERVKGLLKAELKRRNVNYTNYLKSLMNCWPKKRSRHNE
jgi:hypothetical protein